MRTVPVPVARGATRRYCRARAGDRESSQIPSPRVSTSGIPDAWTLRDAGTTVRPVR